MKLLSNLLLLIFLAAALNAQQVVLGEKTIEKMISERQEASKSSTEDQQLFLQAPDFKSPEMNPTAFSPEETQVLSWDNGNLYTAIGGNAFTLDAAIRFEPSDLQNVAGYFLTAIQLFAFDEMDVTLKLWQGPIGNNSEIYAQEVDEFVNGEINTFELTTPVAIDVTQELWIGYTASFETGSYPLGTDDGPAVQFKGDMIRTADGEWESLSADYGIDFNWIIRGQAEVLADPQAPESPQNMIAQAAPEGGFSASISWGNPAQTFGGDPLNELNEIVIERDNQVIGTISNPVIGGEASFEDNTINASGNYTYKVYGVNSFGNGVSASTTVYIGTDIPAAPGNAQLEVEGSDGLVTWQAPQEGINGGYINPNETVYTVKRFPGEVIVASNLAATEFLDTQVPGAGSYFYTVTASNQLGEGGTATTNIAVLGAEGLLMFETFDYPVGQLPPGWTITGVPVNWSIYAVNFAGGEPNELNLNWAPHATGSSRLVTYPISTGELDFYRFRFKQMFESFFGSGVEDKIAIDISFDGG